ncbi:hypothetical protein FH972_025238 [Carpinus fangiana]|uniref:Aldehyde dehydrogenase domain-containing protein n=1 Tax=Carpinus fangiana TaxID=176857 RepID=A0A5N6L0U4_9ROSI|nr:hypothetical protein FH972_025238 [Carpinus fangiana]
MSPSKVSTLDFTTFHNIIDGKTRGSNSTHQGIDPTTKAKLWDVPIGTQQDVNDAVESATKAFKTWSQVPMKQRQAKILEFLDLWGQYEKEFTDLLCRETGKPRIFADQEVKGVAGFAGHPASLTMPEDIQEEEDRTVKTTYTPLGVVGAICPWNFPLLLSAGKIGPALAAGCTIIVKPSPFTPYTTLKMVELMQQTFPVGVVQAIGGDDKLGPMLTAHPDIAKISFTGSIPTGKKIMAACAATLKRVTLELGGNDASIVCADVDIEKTAPEVAMGAFFNSGQVCVATKRIYVHESIYQPFVKKMAEFTKNLKVGNSNDEGVMLGPIQNEMQYEKVKGFFSDSKAKGYKFAAGEPDVQKSNGFFIQPTIVDNPPNDSLIIQEEPFGPIVPVQPWSDEEEVIARANKTTTGLGACVWSKDVAHAEKIGARLEAGSVFINSFEKPSPKAFFSGHKESGIGGEWGSSGIMAYTNAHSMANDEPGGFIPAHVLTPPRSSRAPSSLASSALPTPRRTPLKSGSAKEWTLVDYLDKHIGLVQRRYAKRGTNESASDGTVVDRSGETDYSAKDLEGIEGYDSFQEAGKDIEKLIDIVWVSGTPTLQISYLLSLALMVVTYLPSFPPTPKTLFRVLGKLDMAFASLVTGKDLDTGAPLPGFSTDEGNFGKLGGGVTGTEKVRIKSLVERTRVVVVEVMNASEFEVEEEFESGHADDSDDPMAEARGDDVDFTDYNMDVARVYDRTLVELGDSLAGPRIGIIQDDG